MNDPVMWVLLVVFAATLLGEAFGKLPAWPMVLALFLLVVLGKVPK